MLQINPVVGHRSSPECCPQTGDRWAVSKARLVFDKGSAKQAGCFLKEIAFFVSVLRTAHKRECVSTVDRNLRVAEFLTGDPGTIPCLSNLLCDAVDRLVPADVDPVIRSRRTITGFCQPIR